MADLQWSRLSGFAAGFPDVNDIIPFDRVPPTGTGVTPSGNTHDKLFPMLDIRLFGAVGDGVANDTSAVKAALTRSSRRPAPYPAGHCGCRAGTYRLACWGAYVQSGPIRIRAEQGAVFDGVDAPDDWLNNPLLAESHVDNFLLQAIRFLQFSAYRGWSQLRRASRWTSRA